MTYQDLWGLTPRDGSKREVIGQATLLPLLDSYPEDPTIKPEAYTGTFQVRDLTKNVPTTMLMANDLSTINVKERMLPENLLH